MTPTSLVCERCLHENREGARFCAGCGAALEEIELGVPPEAERRAELATTVPRPAPAAPAMSRVRHWMPPRWMGAVAMAIAIGMAIAGQSALNRSHSPLPGGGLFVGSALFALLGSLGLASPSHLNLSAAARLANRRAMLMALLLSIVSSATALLFFGRGVLLNPAWLLFLLSVLAVVAAAWLADGRPGWRVDWRGEALGWGALAAILVTAAAVRLIWLDRVPFGVWFDGAVSALGVEHIMADPNYRPVFVGDLTQAPVLFWYMAVPFFKLFGATPLAMRLVNAAAGTAGVLGIYLAGRELFSKRIGLIAAAILATLAWSIDFSRFVPNPAPWSATLDALAIFFLLRALKRASWLAAALCGVCIALGMYMYYTSRFMVIILGIVLLAHWLRRPHAHLRPAAQCLAAICVAGLITLAPLLEFGLQHPAVFLQRTAQASILKEVQDAHSLAPLIGSLQQHLLMFNLAGDRNGRHNLPGAPELNVILGGLFIAGLALSLARARRPNYLLLPIWAAIMLAGGVFSVAFEAPQSLRTFDEVNAVALLCALPLGMLWEGIDRLALPARRQGRLRGAWLRPVPGLVVVAAITAYAGYLDVHRYFSLQQPFGSVYSEYSTPETLLARDAVTLPAGTRIYTPPRLDGTPTMRFLAPGLKTTPFATSELPLTIAAPTAIFLEGTDAGSLQTLQHLYPKATVKTMASTNGVPLLYRVTIGEQDIGQSIGVAATYTPDHGQPIQRLEPALNLAAATLPAAAPLQAEFSGVLMAPSYGDYGLELKAPPGAQLTLDEEPLDAVNQAVKLRLAAGGHRLNVTARFTDAAPLQLLWEPPSARSLTVVPQGALLNVPLAANGLLGKYFGNQGWSGIPAKEQIDPTVAFDFHLQPLPLPYSIDWSGQLAAPVAGRYHFALGARDSAELLIDGRRIARGSEPAGGQEGDATLSQGLHTIEVRYEAHTGYSHVELYWQPPGLPRQIIPQDYLFPSQASGQAQPLPALPATAGPAPNQEVGPAQVAKDLAVAWQLDLAKVIGPSSRPDGVAVDGQGNVYVADGGERALEKFDPTGKLLWQQPVPAAGGAPDLAAAAADNAGRVLVLDATSGVIQRFTADGQLIGSIGGPSLATYHPRGLAAAPNGEILLADTGTSRILRLHADGTASGSLGTRGSGSGTLLEPTGVAILASGDVIAVDATLHKIVDFDPSGGAKQEWPLDTNPTVDGPHVAADSNGGFWVTDTQSNQLIHIDATGTAQAYTIPGGFAGPSGIAFGDGGLVVCEPSLKRCEALAAPAS